jgi:hypothetical protein
VRLERDNGSAARQNSIEAANEADTPAPVSASAPSAQDQDERFSAWVVGI